MWSWSGFASYRVRAAAPPTPGQLRGISAALLLIAFLAPLQGAEGEVVPVDLELALAVDVSRSVDEEEARLQRDGYIAAFRHPNVVEAIRHGPLGRIAVSYYEWGGFGNTHTVVGWTVIGDAASAAAFADELARTTPMKARRTGISGAIDYGAALFDRRRFEGRRRVIDISGDGANNSGDLVTAARDRAVAAGITINGLPILNGRASPSGWQQIDTLDLYYRDCVIGGPGAFHIVARDFQDFARAVLRKLVLEIAGDQAPGTAHRQAQSPPPRKAGPLLLRAAADTRKAPPCDVGERRRGQQWYGDDTIMQPPAMQRRP